MTGSAAPVAAQTVMLSLDDAVARAKGQSEEVRLAQSQVDLTETRIRSALSAALPRVDANTGYQRTFTSPVGLNFQSAAGDRFQPDPSAPLDERVGYLEKNAQGLVQTTLSDVLGPAFQTMGLGSPRVYNVNLVGSQLLYSGGRTRAAVGLARHARDAARFTTEEAAADVELQVRTAYYRALLAQELESIAQAALAQAHSFLTQERLRRQSGFASDLDVMRAEVSLENIRPDLVDARNSLELSLLELKRLVNIPLGQPVQLTTALAVPEVLANAAAKLLPDVLASGRAAISASESEIAVAREGVNAALAAYRPSVSFQVSYGAQAFPTGPFNFSGARWQPNGAAGIAVQLPIFSGFQRAADVTQARVQQRQAELRAAQLRESVQLQYEQALGERDRAQATITARQRTVEQAQRVYDLTELQYGSGQATQIEISDARLSLLQARTNLAQALADFYIASAEVTRAIGR